MTPTRPNILLIVTDEERQAIEALAEVIRWHHSYKCPEIVAVSPHEMSPEYHAWWEQSLPSDDSK